MQLVVQHVDAPEGSPALWADQRRGAAHASDLEDELGPKQLSTSAPSGTLLSDTAQGCSGGPTGPGTATSSGSGQASGSVAATDCDEDTASSQASGNTY